MTSNGDLKSVADMTPEEFEAERKAIAAERAALQGRNGHRSDAASTTDVTVDMMEETAEENESVSSAWTHQHMEYAGRVLEVRKPDESALVAISMTGVPSLSPQAKMRIFTKFMVNHLSAESFAIVVEAMTDPESGMDVQGLISALTKIDD